MKKLKTAVILFLISVSAHAQMLEIAKSFVGQKVGDGICGTYVEKCLDIKNPAWRDSICGAKLLIETDSVSFEITQLYGVFVQFEDALPGDVVAMVNSVTLDSHVAIVVDVNKNSITYIDQNSGERTEANSKVGIDCSDMKEFESTDFFVFYRPY